MIIQGWTFVNSKLKFKQVSGLGANSVFGDRPSGARPRCKDGTWGTPLFQAKLLGTPAEHLCRKYRAIEPHRYFVGVKVRSLAWLGTPQNADDLAIRTDFQNAARDGVCHVAA